MVTATMVMGVLRIGSCLGSSESRSSVAVVVVVSVKGLGDRRLAWWTG